MITLIIDATKDEIFLQIINQNKSYTNECSNCKKNFDKLGIIIFNFLRSNNISIDNISNIFVNKGPGKFSSIRSAITTAKGICLSKNIRYFEFSGHQFQKKNYNKILDIFEKEVLIKRNKNI